MYKRQNQLREKEQYNLEKMLEQSVSSIENQSQIYKNLVDYLSYSQNLRNIFDVETESDYEKYLKYVKVADPLLQMPTIYHKEIQSITLYSDNIEGTRYTPIRKKVACLREKHRLRPSCIPAMTVHLLPD